MSKLTHTDLLEFGQQLGYSLDSSGLCQGFSGMLMQAILAEEEGEFWRRLKLIERYKDNFSLLLSKIEEVKCRVKKKEEQLSEQDIRLLELFAFYEGIELYLVPYKHADVFNNRYFLQTNLDEIYALTHPMKLGDDHFTILFDRAYVFHQTSLVNYLNYLAIGLSNYPNVPILINSSNHSVLLKYNKHHPEKHWMYVDTNDFEIYPKLFNYYRELNTEELVHGLFNSLSQNLEHILFHVTLITSQNKLLLDNFELEQLRSQHPIRPEQALIYDKHGAGLLYLSCQYGNIEAITQLLTCKDIKINKAMHDGTTPLFIACQNGHVEAVKYLLACKDIKINQAMHDGTTPLNIACQNGHSEIIKLLLAHQDIKVNEADEYGITPFLIACWNRHIEVLKLLLLQKNIEINKAMSDGTTPLYIACQNGDIEIIKLLLSCKDIKINEAKDDGTTPLYVACQNGHPHVVELFLQSENIDLNGIDLDQYTPLLIAGIGVTTTLAGVGLFAAGVANNKNTHSLVSSETTSHFYNRTALTLS